MLSGDKILHVLDRLGRGIEEGELVWKYERGGNDGEDESVEFEVPDDEQEEHDEQYDEVEPPLGTLDV